VVREPKRPKTRKASKPDRSIELGDETEDAEWTGIVDSEEMEENQQGQSEDTDQPKAPEVLEVVDLPEWSEFNLSRPTLQALSSLGFVSPTGIQSLAIPRIIQGHDLIGKASTGSGKTLAFGIPILEHILSRSPAPTQSRDPVALILAPTRELAKQIVSHLEQIAKFSMGAMTVINVTGGLSVQKQMRLLEKRPAVIVGTPGRLWEVLSSPDLKGLNLDIGKIQFLVLDEADRLLQEGHFKEIEKILELANSEDKQTLVFSATFQKELQQKLKGGKRFEENLLSKDDALGMRVLPSWLTSRIPLA
jgi:ATP-dependent RNA helicase DDX24/MAK5